MAKIGRAAKPLAGRQLAGLLEIPEGQRLSVMEHLKEALSLSAAPHSLKHLNVTPPAQPGIFLPEFHWAACHTARNLARYAGMASVKYISRMPENGGWLSLPRS